MNPVLLDDHLKKIVQNGSVLVANDQQVLYRFPKQKDALMVPASVFKYATALVALRKLGADFRFQTKFYLDKANSLVIKGSGDPFLISEEWNQIAENLNKNSHLPRKLTSIIYDLSSFSENIKIPGIENSNNPYDAKSGSFTINFNTLNVQIASNRMARSAEVQTPLTQTAIELSKNLKPGKHRINLTEDSAFLYYSELLHAFLGEKGLQFRSSKFSFREINADDILIYTHQNSRTLSDVIAGMMRYSNNFTANQLLLRTGMEKFGAPITLEKSVVVLNNYLSGVLKIPEHKFVVREGSGISRENRLTAESTLILLKAFYPFKHLLSGKHGVLYKTGTLTGVYSMAGYLPGKQPLYFVILLNQSKNQREQILKLLLKTNWQLSENG